MSVRKLGKSPFIPDAHHLMLREVIVPKLAPAPPVCDWYRYQHGPRRMWKNNIYGDCAWAGAANQITVETAVAGHEFDPPEKEVVAGYLKMSPDDEGCQLANVLNLWRKTGICGHKIGAYALIEPTNIELIKQAIFLLGSAYLGVMLPASVQESSRWTLPPTWAPVGAWRIGSWGGHCVQASKYDRDGIYVRSWDELIFVSWEFFTAYFDEAWGTFSLDFIRSDGKNINGIDKAFLLDDLGALAA